MNDRYPTTMSCSDKDCEFYFVPVEVDVVRERDTGASYVARDQDSYCECGAERVDYDSLTKFDLHVVEWMADKIRSGYRQLTEAVA